MKRKYILAMLILFFSGAIFAQDRTTVTATNDEISDNLDLRAVASVFGDSENLEDFERRLNDPKLQISNLDLNRDYQVDYLRVIESVEGNTHLIVIQSVLGKDLFQDVATVEVERDRNNNVQVQVVGDVYMYGNNYIYEPVYVYTPAIYSTFWVSHYRPYWSVWNWGYYPVYYSAWAPYPVHTYWTNVHHHINVHHHYNYVSGRRSSRALAMHNSVRANAYEVRHPERSFTRRNTAVTNYRELDQVRNNGTRTASTVGVRTAETGSVRTSGVRTSNLNPSTTSNTTPATVRNSGGTRSTAATAPTNGGTRTAAPSGVRQTQSATGTKSVQSSGTRTSAPTTSGTVRQSGTRSTEASAPRTSTVRTQSAPTVRQAAPAQRNYQPQQPPQSRTSSATRSTATQGSSRSQSNSRR